MFEIKKTVFMIIYSMQTRILTTYNISVSIIEQYFIKIFAEITISCNSFWRIFRLIRCLFPVAMETKEDIGIEQQLYEIVRGKKFALHFFELKVYRDDNDYKRSNS